MKYNESPPYLDQSKIDRKDKHFPIIYGLMPIYNKKTSSNSAGERRDQPEYIRETHLLGHSIETQAKKNRE